MGSEMCIRDRELLKTLAKNQELLLAALESKTSSRTSTRAPSRRTLSPGVTKKIKAAVEQQGEHSAMRYDLSPTNIVDGLTIGYWNTARNAVTQCHDAQHEPIANMTELRNRTNRQVYDDLPKLGFHDRLGFQTWLQSCRIYMIQQNITKDLILEIVKSKVYPELAHHLQAQTQSLALKTENDLVTALTRYLYSGFTASTLKKKFISINNEKVMKGGDIVTIYSDIKKSQSQILTDLSEIPAKTAADRDFMVEHITKELVMECLTPQQESVLGIQGLLESPTDRLVEGISRINLYNKQGTTRTINAINIDKGAMALLDNVDTSPMKPSNPPPDEFTKLKQIIKKQEATIEAMRKEKGKDGTNVVGWRRKCRQCTENKNPDCRHCWWHTPILFEDCQDPSCLQKKERRANQSHQ